MLSRLIEFCVRKRLPVLALTAAIAAYGVKAYLDLPVEAFPDVTNLQVQVIAQLPGLAPEEIERQVTVPIERVLNGTPQMALMRSESLFGLSLVTLTFDDDADPSRLLANGLTPVDVTNALALSNRNVGGGFLEHGDQQLTIRGVGYLLNPHDVQAVVLKSEKGTPVTIGDVSRVTLSHMPRLGTVGYDLNNNVAEGFVLMRRGENPSVVLEGVHEQVKEL